MNISYYATCLSSLPLQNQLLFHFKMKFLFWSWACNFFHWKTTSQLYIYICLKRCKASMPQYMLVMLCSTYKLYTSSGLPWFKPKTLGLTCTLCMAKSFYLLKVHRNSKEVHGLFSDVICKALDNFCFSGFCTSPSFQLKTLHIWGLSPPLCVGAVSVKMKSQYWLRLWMLLSKQKWFLIIICRFLTWKQAHEERDVEMSWWFWGHHTLVLYSSGL